MTKHKPGTIRIIGGHWRRHLLHFPDVPGLRPTHDRIRETLFNWLMPYIKGARCLDLFAGSGALGFEALSRDAEAVSFVDSHTKVVDYIKQTAISLGVESDTFEVILGRCPEQSIPLHFKPYDIVFLDPPYKDHRMAQILAWLEKNECLSDEALIYMEMEKQREPIQFDGWKILKEGHTKTISYFLFSRGV
ncbi:MAG: 16S rRNA (guanine(966)-N(2))-methyltransferase RsmD [Coxiellaceae bacterium]|nr:16S rRNA (guanine(966)-N(2))-methyltransferase RsmD [Coxiellaceae bacterium]